LVRDFDANPQPAASLWLWRLRVFEHRPALNRAERANWVLRLHLL
jgi:hypothetical protein